MDERLVIAMAKDEKLAKLVSEAEKEGIKIVVANKGEEAPKPVAPPDIAMMVDYQMAPRIPIIDYPSGQESRRKRRETERKIKKGKKLF